VRPALGREIGRMSVGFEELRRLITSHAPSFLMKNQRGEPVGLAACVVVDPRAIDRTSREALHAI
jgi:hypothetical protein